MGKHILVKESERKNEKSRDFVQLSNQDGYEFFLLPEKKVAQIFACQGVLTVEELIGQRC